LKAINYSVEHIGIAARNTVVMRDWYMRTLGAELVFANDHTPPAFFLELPGGLLIEIYPAKFSITETSENTLAGWRHLALTVDSIEASRAELAALGVAFQDEIKPAGGGGRVLFFRDPEGNLLHFVERVSPDWRTKSRSQLQ
jgi:glyoxylase I family protein